MASVPEIIEGVFVDHASEIDGINKVYQYEPRTVDRKNMPMLAMFYLLPEAAVAATRGEMATGPMEDVDYRWEISLYVSLTDFEKAQGEMRDIGQAVIENFRRNRGKYDLHPVVDMYARALRRRNPPTPDEDGTFLRASWELQITAGEA